MSHLNKTETIKYDNGGWAEIQTLDGEYHGSWTVFRKGGSKSWQRHYKAGLQHGSHQNWFENGQLEYERNFVNDELHGPSLAWHQNGQLKSESQFVKGEQRGLSRWYSVSGEILAEMTIADDGQRHGTQIACLVIEDGSATARLGISRFYKGEYQGCEYFENLPEGYSVKP